MCVVLMEEQQEFTLEEVARRLRVSYWTARRRCLSGQIRYRKEGNQLRISKEDLQAYICRTYGGDTNTRNVA